MYEIVHGDWYKNQRLLILSDEMKRESAAVFQLNSFIRSILSI